MNKQQVLEQAIYKAMHNGWSGLLYGIDWREVDVEEMLRLHHEYATELLFNHAFAKALWGDHDMWVDPRLWTEDLTKAMAGHEAVILADNKTWQYHLRMMVIAEDPIKYLAENIWLK